MASRRDRVAWVLAVTLAAVLVILAVAGLWAVVAGSQLTEAVTRFWTVILGALIGALAAYVGVRGGRNGNGEG